MRHPLILATALGLAALTQAATAEMIEKVSPHTVSVTIDRLQAAVEEAGATVFARVDHAKGAASVDVEMRPTQMLMFGNPALGTPAILASQTVGLDLPLRVLAYADGDGQVHVIYHAPNSLVAEHGLSADAEYIKKMTGALNNLTNKAIASE